MQLIHIDNNMTEVGIEGVSILFSYETPVAMHNAYGYFRTNKKWGLTTNRHINKWLGSIKANEVEQTVLDDLINNIGFYN